jgi:hypothetical protein
MYGMSRRPVPCTLPIARTRRSLTDTRCTPTNPALHARCQQQTPLPRPLLPSYLTLMSTAVLYVLHRYIHRSLQSLCPFTLLF